MRRKSRHQAISKYLFLLVLLISCSARAAGSWTLSASEWSRPRSGEAVLAMEPVAEAVRAWQAADAATGTSRLQLLYPGGEEGSLWAAELHDWLVALGVPPGAIEVVAGGDPGQLEIRLLN
ncbi:MAG TPA: hypothetical protein VF275_02595 [Gammaproteobacteria bacterium]